MAEPTEIADPEIVIVGAGPVGLFAAYYAGFRALRCTILESLPFVGGQIATFYADSLIYDVPGFPSVRGAELLERLRTQAFAFEPSLRLGVRVTGLDADEAGARLRWRSEDGDRSGTIDTRAVLLATGIGRFAPQPIGDPSLERWNGRGLQYHLADPGTLRGRRVLVAGGTPRGVEVALAASDAGADVFLVHRRDRLAVAPDLRERFDASAVEFLPFRELVALEGGQTVERAVLSDRRGGDPRTLAVDVVLPCFGFAAHKDALADFGTPLEDGAIPVDSTMRAGPSLWAAGDAATYPGKVRVLAADFGEACTAVNNIAAAVQPGASLFPGYSSHRAGTARRPA